MKKYFLDCASTTQPYKEVVNVVADVMYNHYGNPSSTHEMGQDAKNIIENVRDQIAADINCEPKEIIFTSGGVEANTLALCGTNFDTIITTQLEHKSISEILNHHKFTNVHYIPVDEFGNIDANILEDTIKEHNNSIVSIQYANSEIGTLQDIKSISYITHKYNCILHVDAVQYFPESRIDVDKLRIDMMSISAQKFRGGRGAGFLYCKDTIDLSPIIYGSQELHKRGGTENTPAIAAMGKALEINRGTLHDYTNICTRFNRDELAKKILEIPGVHLNGPELDTNRLCNNISVRIDGVKASDLVTIASMCGIYISAGSACSSGETVPSSTLKAIGLTDAEALSTIRITLDETLNQHDISDIVKILKKLIERLRTS